MAGTRASALLTPSTPLQGGTAHPWEQSPSQNGAKVNAWCHSALCLAGLPLCTIISQLWELTLAARGEKPPVLSAEAAPLTLSAGQ